MQRYDVYGFSNPDIKDAAAFVEKALGVSLTPRDSSYRGGLYYCAGEGTANDYLLESNSEGSTWHSRYPEYEITLMVNKLPEMDTIREKLTAGRTDPVFLHSIIRERPHDEPDDESD